MPYPATQLGETVTMPPRSRLFHLAPVGVGTPFVESMTGYVMRLAETHLVSPKALLVHELLPLFGRSFLLDSHQNFLASFWANNVPTLNGTQTWAYDWVRIVEQLTMQPDLRFLTMLPWANVLASRQLIRRTRAWCSDCHAEWQQQGRSVYEPLLWTLTCITVCHTHHCELDSLCPVCQRTQPLLGPESRPGYCAWCQTRLSRAVAVHQDCRERVVGEEAQRHIWMVDAVGELLAAAPSIRKPLEQGIIAERLAVYLTPLLKEGKLRRDPSAPVTRETLRDLRTGQTVPQLSARCCAR